MKKIFITVLFVFIHVSILAGDITCDKMSLGAIRWDAWHGNDMAIGKAVTKSLGQDKWQERWPFFYTQTDQGIIFDESKLEVIQREDNQAHDAGIDYWAFVFYGKDSPMSRVLNNYLSLPKKHTCFTLIIEAGRIADPERGEAIKEQIINLMSNKKYFTGRDKKPLLFLMFAGGVDDNERVDGQLKGAESLIVLLKRKNIDPNIVVMSFNPNHASDMARKIGSGTISSYVSHGIKQGGSYKELAKSTEKFWDRQYQTGMNVIPVVMTGWDPRPRFENPVPWGNGYPDGSYYEQGNPDEIVNHLQHAVEWTKNHPNSACSTIIYAWNEFDEGGWLVPTMDSDTKRLDAIKNILKY